MAGPGYRSVGDASCTDLDGLEDRVIVLLYSSGNTGPEKSFALEASGASREIGTAACLDTDMSSFDTPRTGRRTGTGEDVEVDVASLRVTDDVPFVYGPELEELEE